MIESSKLFNSLQNINNLSTISKSTIIENDAPLGLSMSTKKKSDTKLQQISPQVLPHQTTSMNLTTNHNLSQQIPSQQMTSPLILNDG